MADQTARPARNPEFPKFVTVFKREFLERVRTKWFIISTLLIPLFLVGSMVLPVWLAARSRATQAVSSVRILDATGVGLGARVARVLTSDSSRATDSARHTPDVRVVAPGELASAEDQAMRDVMGKRIPGYLVLDAATVNGDSARYAGRNASTVPDVERLRSAVRQGVMAARLEASGLDSNRVASLTNVRVRLPAIRITDKGKAGAGGFGGYIVGFMIAFLLYFILAVYGQAVLRGVMEEKTTRVAEVIVSSVSPTTLLAGKILGVGAVAALQQVLWVAVSSGVTTLLAPTMLRLSERAGTSATVTRAGSMAMMSGLLPQFSWTTVAVILLFFVLGFLFYASLFAAVGATVNSEQDAQQASAPIMFLLVPTILMVQPIALNPTSTLATVMSMLPFSAPIIMPMRMAMLQIPTWELAASIASTMLGCVLAIWLAAKIYRVGLLMYGKRPTYREMMKWLRYA